MKFMKLFLLNKTPLFMAIEMMNMDIINLLLSNRFLDVNKLYILKTNLFYTIYIQIFKLQEDF